METQYYYAGGTGREVCSPIKELIANITHNVEVSVYERNGVLYSEEASGNRNVDRIRRMALNDVNNPEHCTMDMYWTQFIDSQFAF